MPSALALPPKHVNMHVQEGLPTKTVRNWCTCKSRIGFPLGPRCMALICRLRAAHHKTRLQQRAQCTSTENKSSTEAHARPRVGPYAVIVSSNLHTCVALPCLGRCMCANCSAQ